MEQNEFELLDPTCFSRHPLHEKTFFSPNEKRKQASYAASISKYGKLKPVFYIQNKAAREVIDGWGYIQYAIDKGLNVVVAKRVEAKTKEDVHSIMLELQASDHNSVEEEYRIYAAAYDTFSKGKGYRSDLDDDCSDDKDDKKKRRPTVFDKIAEITNASSAKRVQYMLKVGKVNPHYLERMNVERMSLYTAYLSCKAEEKNYEPPIPKVKSPVFTSTSTGTPVFSDSTLTNGQEAPAFNDVENVGEGGVAESDSSNVTPFETEQPPELNTSETEVYIDFETLCSHCKKKTIVRIYKKDTLW